MAAVTVPSSAISEKKIKRRNCCVREGVGMTFGVFGRVRVVFMLIVDHLREVPLRGVVRELGGHNHSIERANMSYF